LSVARVLADLTENRGESPQQSWRKSSWFGPEPSDRNIDDIVVAVVGTDQQHPADVGCCPERKSITECWRVAEFEVGCSRPCLFGVDATDATFLEDVDDGISPVLAVDCPHDIVDLGKIDRRDVTVCCAFNGVNVRFDGVAPWFVTKTRD